MPSAFVAALPDNAVIAVSGDDAAAFLHAQFTNDVLALAEGHAQWSGWCTPKGRLYATFLLVRRKEGFLLALPAELAAAFAKRLAMFVLRSRVRIEEASASLSCLGVAGEDSARIVARLWGAAPAPMALAQHGDALCVGLEDQRYLVLVPAGAAAALQQELAAQARTGTREEWEWAAVHAGVPTIVTATREAFVPQMANFELVGGVSFKKGCYPGQEIVARTQYRGILKRRMALAHVAGGEAPRPGDHVYSDAFGEQSAGTVVNAAPSPGGGYDALVVAQVEGLAKRDLHWKTPAGPALEILSHPPLEAA